MIVETVPNHLLGAYGIATNLTLNIGIFISMLIGIVLPNNND
jgi:hypothetical protein